MNTIGCQTINHWWWWWGRRRLCHTFCLSSMQGLNRFDSHQDHYTREGSINNRLTFFCVVIISELSEREEGVWCGKVWIRRVPPDDDTITHRPLLLSTVKNAIHDAHKKRSEESLTYFDSCYGRDAPSIFHYINSSWFLSDDMPWEQEGRACRTNLFIRLAKSDDDDGSIHFLNPRTSCYKRANLQFDFYKFIIRLGSFQGDS